MAERAAATDGAPARRYAGCSDLIAFASHELRTPAAAVSGIAAVAPHGARFEFVLPVSVN